MHKIAKHIYSYHAGLSQNLDGILLEIVRENSIHAIAHVSQEET